MGVNELIRSIKTPHAFGIKIKSLGMFDYFKIRKSHGN